MISFIKKKLIERFPFYCVNATMSRFKLTLPSGEFVYVKKLDDKKRPSNIETVENNEILFQVTKDKRDTAGNIFIGYNCQSYSSVDAVYVVCLKGDELVWHQNILELQKSERAKIVDFSLTQKNVKLKDSAKPNKNISDNQRE